MSKFQKLDKGLAKVFFVKRRYIYNMFHFFQGQKINLNVKKTALRRNKNGLYMYVFTFLRNKSILEFSQFMETGGIFDIEGHFKK